MGLNVNYCKGSPKIPPILRREFAVDWLWYLSVGMSSSIAYYSSLSEQPPRVEISASATAETVGRRLPPPAAAVGRTLPRRTEAVEPRHPRLTEGVTRRIPRPVAGVGLRPSRPAAAIECPIPRPAVEVRRLPAVRRRPPRTPAPRPH